MSLTAARRWAVVLAGGDGQRMRPFLRRWLGEPRPKQFCAFAGGRTMLEHTLARARGAVGPDRVVTVILEEHRRWLHKPGSPEAPGIVIAQPARRDTGPGVFLPLAKVMKRDPRALVAILPSDHFVHPLDRFHELVNEAFVVAERLPRHLVLLAAPPDKPETEYGWIRTGPRLSAATARFVRGFREKPSFPEARALYEGGALWNTMILVARAEALWRLGWDLQPAMLARMQALLGKLDGPDEAASIAAAYAEMPSVNFSKDILERAVDWTIALPMDGLRWSDWGRPGRVLETLKSLGRSPAFPESLADEAAAESPVDGSWDAFGPPLAASAAHAAARR